MAASGPVVIRAGRSRARGSRGTRARGGDEHRGGHRRRGVDGRSRARGLLEAMLVCQEKQRKNNSWSLVCQVGTSLGREGFLSRSSYAVSKKCSFHNTCKRNCLSRQRRPSLPFPLVVVSATNNLRGLLRRHLHLRVGGDQVTVSVHVVDARGGGPELGLPDPLSRERSRLSCCTACPTCRTGRRRRCEARA